ncbi:uncharacterized protein E0L32_006839 [Thyridium curvatum]|uniref:Pre-rRNA-processing protein PNO1 n=1 Tax=Thyridium curvatum TaxID=1093900 RepID=A0A507AY38_9PEZI|nr:uncharacterized protein E0L32_006839 [Thyridium curvatum]TPX12427.1 hypothetical protein E0L32_006839 [Thyridium curvatum]
MPAPTALLKKEEPALAQDIPLPEADRVEEVLLDATDADFSQPAALEPAADADTEMVLDEEARPKFPASKDVETATRREQRKVPIPPHRMSPLRTSWMKICDPLVTHLKLQVRMNVKSKAVELRTSRHTTDPGALQKGEDFIRAFSLGFDVDDAIALLRLDDLYIQSFEIKDVKTLEGDHLARAIGRIAGKDGRTKFAIENTTRTRIVLADSKVHILGGFKNIGMARESVVSLILGKTPGRVYDNLRTISARMKERF